ncbi:MAG: zinc metallopeptidase [Clostridia bacterium]|nr:zinc metallopeptidase [Clostridia bacterium]
MPFYYYFDSTYILVLIAFALSAFASFGVNATFAKYNKVRSSRGITGADAARRILDGNGLSNVRVEHISGNLNDHFDPKANVIRLSDATYADNSVAAIGVAAHEAGHAVQHAIGYKPIKARNAIVPLVNISTSLSMPIFLIGLLLDFFGLTLIGIILFSASLVFQLITLPVELNASKRALSILNTSGMLEGEELSGARKVLRAAAMTYVAAVAASALQLFRLLLLANRRRD